MSESSLQKTLQADLEIITAWREAGDNIVFTNGVFDILHVGHVTYLEAAKNLGHRLVLGLNGDESVRRLNKSPNRPIHTESDRKRVLQGLRAVDMVLVFKDDTPLEMIACIQPDVLVKGGDYDPDCTDVNDKTYIVGSHEIVTAGGRVAVLPFVPGHSTTSIIEKSRTTS